MDASCFETERGCTYGISSIVSAYNDSTKDTRIYMEMDRTNEQLITDFLISCEAASVRVDSFAGGWEVGSAIALANVTECGLKNGFTLMKSGEEPKARPSPRNTTTQNGEVHDPLNRANGKRSSPSGNNGSEESREKRAHNEQIHSSPYNIPESVPAYVYQFTANSIANSIASNMSRTMGEQAGESYTKLRRVEDELEQQRRIAIEALAELRVMRQTKVII